MFVRRFLVVLLVVMLMAFAFAPSALAHNAGRVFTGNGGCVEVGAGNAPPEGVAVGNAEHPRGIHHAIHAGNGNSAVEGGSCS